MPTDQYVFKITEVVKVTDGDTYWFRLSIGFRETILVNIRLFGYDCPEKTKGTPFERAEAKRAQALSTAFLARTDGQLWVRTEPDPDNFGRWLGDVWIETGDTRRHLGAELRESGLASIWPTRWREEHSEGAPT